LSSLSLRANFQLNWKFSAQAGIQPIVNSQQLKLNLSLSNGSGVGQIGEMFADEYQISTGTQTLDLYNVLRDIQGDLIDFTAIRALLVVNNGTPSGGGFVKNADAILLVGGGGSGSHAWGAPFSGDQTAQMPVGAGDWLWLSSQLAGLTVNSSTSHILQFQHSGSEEIDYTVALFGIT
jgi:hypothetical protein